MMRNWLWALISVASVAAADPPPRIEITYTLTRNGSTMAEVTERLEYSAGNYQLTETWKGKGFYALLGSARRQSVGTIEKGVLRPREFFDERSGRDTARAWFDWKAQTLTMQYKGNKGSEPLPANAQDRLSFLFALSLLPGSNADSVSYSIADGKGLSRHTYKLVGRERIRTPIGEFDTVKAARQGDDKETAEVWLAPQYSYIPLRLVVIDKDGTRLEQLPTRISQ
jgi:uncharacterized protein DUF3108